MRRLDGVRSDAEQENELRWRMVSLPCLKTGQPHRPARGKSLVFPAISRRNPYLRPLYDALYGYDGFEWASALITKGVIEMLFYE